MTAVLEPQTTEAFEDLVAQDVRGVIDQDSAEWLRLPENADRWYDALNALHRSLDAQLTAKRAEIEQRKSDNTATFAEDRARAEEWRARTVRFKAGVQNRLAEAKHIRKNHTNIGFNEIVMKERARAVREVLRLRTLILEHRDHRCGDECTEDMCIADTDLWAVLEKDPEL